MAAVLDWGGTRESWARRWAAVPHMERDPSRSAHMNRVLEIDPTSRTEARSSNGYSILAFRSTVRFCGPRFTASPGHLWLHRTLNMGFRVRDARRQGAKLCCIDPFGRQPSASRSAGDLTHRLGLQKDGVDGLRFTGTSKLLLKCHTVGHFTPITRQAATLREKPFAIVKRDREDPKRWRDDHRYTRLRGGR